MVFLKSVLLCTRHKLKEVLAVFELEHVDENMKHIRQREESSSTVTPPCGLSHLFHPHTHLWPVPEDTAGCLHLLNPPILHHTHPLIVTPPKTPHQWITPLLSPPTVLQQSSRLSSSAAGWPRQLSPWLPAGITPNRETDAAPEEEEKGGGGGGGAV